MSAAERSVVACVLTEPQLVDVTLAQIASDEFEDTDMAYLWGAIRRMRSASLAVDSLSLVAFCDNDGRPMATTIASLMDEYPDTNNLPSYVSLMKEAAARRAIIDATRNAAVFINNGASVGDVIANLQRSIKTAETLNAQHITQSKSMREMMDDATVYLLRQMKLRGRIPGITTGFASLDGMTGGLQRQELFVIGARPGVGKSALALAIAVNAARKNHRVLFFSMEMSARSLALRAASADSGVNGLRMRFGNINNKEAEALAQSASRLSALPLMIDDTPALKVSDIHNRTFRHSAIEGVDLVVVDYLQIMSASRGRQRYEEVGAFAAGLKVVARELNVAMVALSQLNRRVDNSDAPPTLSDLKESSGIEEASDVVLLLHTAGCDTPNGRRAIIAKQRNGPTGDVQLGFLASVASFCEINSVDADVVDVDA